MKYRALQKTDKIGIVTPSWAGPTINPPKYKNGLKNLEALGFELEIGTLTRSGKSQGYRLGTPKERAAEINELYANPAVGAIMCTIGGNCSASVLELLDWDLIKKTRKLFCGYSDITSLHCGFIHAGLRSLYGPAVIPTFGKFEEPMAYSVDSFLLQAGLKRVKLPHYHSLPPTYTNHYRDFSQENWHWQHNIFENEGWNCVNEGAIEAELLALNQSTLLSQAGTKYFPNVENKLLLIENGTSNLAMEERQLQQLKSIGVFDQVKGLIFSKFEIFDREDSPLSFEDLVKEIVPQRQGFPIITNFDCGHTFPMISLPQMTRFGLNATQARVDFYQLELAFD